MKKTKRSALISHSMASMLIRPSMVSTKYVQKQIRTGGNIMLIKVEAIVREEMFEDVKAALNQIEVNASPSPRSWDAAPRRDTARSYAAPKSILSFFRR